MSDTTTTQQTAALGGRYEAVRAATEALAAPLSPEDQTVQSMPDVSPTKWHRAHTTWFFETFLLEAFDRSYSSFDPAYGYLFNSYYEAVGARYPRAARGLVSRPGLDEIARYRRHVDEAMAPLLETRDDQAFQVLATLGLHHEQQHQELLLMDIKHVLSMSPLHPAYATTPAASGRPATTAARSAGWLGHDGGLVEVGHDGEGFSFDNEQPRHACYLEPFELASALVTCGEWADFVDDGGYDRPDLWLSEGWATVQAERWSSPLYWSDEDGFRQVFTLHGLRPLDPAEPVCHVSYFEADAYARWAGARLPTEQEWEAVAGPLATDDREALRLHPVATCSSDWTGGTWQWTSSSYAPYPGFRVAPGAVGEYNGKFMVNQYVLRGGACVTPIGHTRPTYRNFFGAASRWPFTGLRLARDGERRA